MPRASIGTTNVGLSSPLTTLIGTAPFPPNARQMTWIRTQTFPTQGSPANVSTYAVAASQFLYNIRIRSNNGSFGYVGFTSPYTIDTIGLGTNFIGSTLQAHSFYHSTITIRAYATYPYAFQRWQIEETGSTYSFSNPVSIGSGDAVIINGQSLVAIFA